MQYNRCRTTAPRLTCHLGILMRSHKAILLEATLLASQPEAIATFLKTQLVRHLETGDMDGELETALLGLNHRLVDLALASHTAFSTTARALFDRNDLALRVALFANQTQRSVFFGFRLDDLFDDGAEGLTRYLVMCSDEERDALFQNPTINDRFLSDFLSCGALWQAMSEDQRQQAVFSLAQNERMHTSYSSPFMDGQAEFDYERVFHEAWRLASKLPVTNTWASRLSSLYEHLPAEAMDLDDPLATAQRWEGNTWPYLSIRQSLARLALSTKDASLSTLLNHSDPAFRMAAYQFGNLSRDDLSAAFKRDGEDAFSAMVCNEHLWRDIEYRNALHDMAWCVISEQNDGSLDTANRFNAIRDRMASTHPEWFAEEQADTDPGSAPASKADIEAIGKQLEQPIDSVASMKQMIEEVHKQRGWLWWLSLGTLIGVFATRL
ncbi:hypothetical protein [Gulbenkiania mobilis]|uniref:hypothetical protein n=1 Tax=Gulbenkiania mobilis TaxID=397457 RepID=UPI0006BBCF62|nr:hypothetical protein [Gulbenkiania mobilis]